MILVKIIACRAGRIPLGFRVNESAYISTKAAQVPFIDKLDVVFALGRAMGLSWMRGGTGLAESARGLLRQRAGSDDG